MGTLRLLRDRASGSGRGSWLDSGENTCGILWAPRQSDSSLCDSLCGQKGPPDGTLRLYAAVPTATCFQGLCPPGCLHQV